LIIGGFFFITKNNSRDKPADGIGNIGINISDEYAQAEDLGDGLATSDCSISYL